MTFCNAVHKCERIGGYNQAVRHFEYTKRPRSVRWDADERPLYNTASHHYRLVRGPNGEYYDAVLYRTPMVRYMRPDDDGTEMTYLHYDNRRASRNFFWSMFRTDYGGAVPFELGERLHVPVSWNDTHDVEINGVMIPSGFYAALRFNPDTKRYIQHRSAHRIVYTKVSSAEDKEDRARVRKAMEWLVDMMVMRIHTFHENASVSRSRGRAFGGAKYTPHGLHRIVPHAIEEQFSLPEEIAKLEVTAQEVYNVGISKVAVEIPQSTNYNTYWTLNTPEQPLPAATFRKALMDKIVKLSGTHTQSGKQELPLFPDTLPNKYFCK